MLAALWTDGPLPPEYVDLLLMRDVFHCPPSALYEQNADDVSTVLLMLEAEAENQRSKYHNRK